MIKLKSSVRFKQLRPEIYNLFPKIDAIWSKHQMDATITSANDSKHMEGSLHYVDLAVDLRSKDLIGEKLPAVLAALKKACGPNYDVLLESKGTPNEHIHVEFDPG